uniref:Uncharacterized protein n=1 Tax=Arundo donax TaxID=35708 RepID=A0A0A9HIK2_ARUDO
MRRNNGALSPMVSRNQSNLGAASRAPRLLVKIPKSSGMT